MMKIEEVVVEFLGCGHGVSVVALVWRSRYWRVTPSDVWWRRMFRTTTTDLEEGEGSGDIYIQYVRGTDGYLHAP